MQLKLKTNSFTWAIFNSMNDGTDGQQSCSISLDKELGLTLFLTHLLRPIHSVVEEVVGRWVRWWMLSRNTRRQVKSIHQHSVALTGSEWKADIVFPLGMGSWSTRTNAPPPRCMHSGCSANMPKDREWLVSVLIRTGTAKCTCVVTGETENLIQTQAMT